MLNLANIIEQIGKDKGIEKKVLIEAIESAVQKAAERRFGAGKAIEARYDEETGEIEVFEFKTVVEEVANPDTEISFGDAKKLDPDAQAGDSLGVKLDSKGFGRIDAQTAKQIIIQKVREAERDMILKEYGQKKGEIVTGLVLRFERGDMIVDLGRTEAVLQRREQVRREVYRQGERIRGLVMEVRSEPRGPYVVISRAQPEFLVRLFQMEVPEIYEGIVEIKAVAREPGERAKIAVSSRNADVDAVGACVGVRGSRVQAVVQELRGEKIDIIHYCEDPAVLVKNALSPAEISRVIVDEAERSMEVVVADDQLSLAIGKKGQNVRLAVKLTGWKIDIKTESEAKGAVSPEEALRLEVEAASRRVEEKLKEDIESIEGIGEKTAQKLKEKGFSTIGDIIKTTAEGLEEIEGIGKKKAGSIMEAAKKYVEEG